MYDFAEHRKLAAFFPLSGDLSRIKPPKTVLNPHDLVITDSFFDDMDMAHQYLKWLNGVSTILLLKPGRRLR